MSAARRAKSLYLLDTNTVDYIVSGRSPKARSMMAKVLPHSPIAISAVTEGEIFYGLAKKPAATELRAGVEALLATIQILPWDSEAAQVYGTMRARMSVEGRTLATLDMLIAAHAVAKKAILVTRDAAFERTGGVYLVVNWATDA